MRPPGLSPSLFPRHGLLIRSILFILLASVLAGVLSVAYTAWATDQRAHLASTQRLNELLDTVESSLQVACFAKDTTLAGDLARGLLGNSDLMAVSISSDNQILAQVQRYGSTPEDRPRAALHLRREIHSPFDAASVVGTVLLTPNPEVIEARISEEVRIAVIQLSGQLVMVACILVAIILLFVVRPIKAMSDRLHSMDPTAGDRLTVPRRHARSEIGQLARDINLLADRLVNALAVERTLRMQQEIDEKKYHAIFDNADSGIFIVDEQGSLNSWNPAFARLFEHDPTPANDELAWLNLELLTWDQPGEMADLIRDALKVNASLAKDLLIHLHDGRYRWLNVNLSPVGNGLLQGVVHDVTQLKEAEVSARRLVVTDPLTGAANRAGLVERLHGHVREFTFSQTGGFALLLINLDDFRHVNEGLGLPAGDHILKATASRLSACVKREDTLARLAADSFAVILKLVTQGDAADKIANRILASLRETHFVDGSPINLHASIGISLCPHDGTDVPSLLRQAELAMDSAKSQGGNVCVFFNPQLARAAEQRRHLETDLRGALRDGDLVLYFQPVADLHRNRLAGAEALIRWRHPTRGLVTPDDFIPIAERTGLIVEVGLFVLESACRQLQTWSAAGLEHVLSLNVSGRQIPEGLSPARLLEVTDRYGVDRSRLALEITEGVMLRDINKSLVWLKAVHELGFRVYLDDFGTGYSSLSYLKLFPVDTLKVDKSFVRDMGESRNDHTLVGAIIAMARSLELDVVAEGVETPAQARALKNMGCQFAQGFLFSRPMPIEEFPAATARVESLLVGMASGTGG